MIYLKNQVTYPPWHQLDSSMVKMNQDVMLTRSFKLFSLIYFFRHLIINIDYDQIIENLDNSEDKYKIYFQKIMILHVIQQIL